MSSPYENKQNQKNIEKSFSEFMESKSNSVSPSNKKEELPSSKLNSPDLRDSSYNRVLFPPPALQKVKINVKNSRTFLNNSPIMKN